MLDTSHRVHRFPSEVNVELQEKSLTGAHGNPPLDIHQGAASAPAALFTPSTGLGKLLATLTPAALSLGLGLWGLDRNNSMWRDESATYQVSHRSLSEIYDLTNHADAVHGVYYAFMHELFKFWDGGLFALRLPSVWAISLSAGLIGLIGYRIAGTRVGLLSGLAFAISPAVQMYAQEGRSYAMVCALVALATYLLVRLIDNSSKMLWAAYTLSALAATWLHEFAALALVAHGITVITLPRNSGVRKYWWMSVGFTLLCLLPLALFSAGQSGQVSWIGNPKILDWLQISGLAVLAYLCFRFRPQAWGHRVLNQLAIPLAIAPTACLLVGSLIQKMYVERYVLYSTIGASLLIGMALDRGFKHARSLHQESRRRIYAAGITTASLAVVAALIPVTLELRTPSSRKDDVTAIAETVQKVSRRGDSVIFAPSRRREWKLSYPNRFDGLKDLALAQDPATSGTLEGVEISASRIRSRMVSAERIVVLSDPPGQPEDPFTKEVMKRQVLRTNFTECSREQVRGAQVTVYAKPGMCLTGERRAK
ncbi:glycosyltransferase family 39 protein (plasmid) [Streptomyces sp. NBC_00876]|uniref:glycosyltransferase family 39 protein n=1 Tax=Streptomyces sp. NBC_00876 TaxID=2975853 RepID=UPI003869BBEB|nr:glycosyltransferase family 39 protein [Streptomyces sp. NBC_00876]